MRLSLDNNQQSYLINAYSEHSVTINGQVYGESVVVCREQLRSDWLPKEFALLSEAHFEQVLTLKPELVLLGTGSKQHFPHPRLVRSLIEHGIGVEAMSTPAACRTYNILLTEGRQVAAMLILE